MTLHKSHCIDLDEDNDTEMTDHTFQTKIHLFGVAWDNTSLWRENPSQKHQNPILLFTQTSVSILNHSNSLQKIQVNKIKRIMLPKNPCLTKFNLYILFISSAETSCPMTLIMQNDAFHQLIQFLTLLLKLHQFQSKINQIQLTYARMTLNSSVAEITLKSNKKFQIHLTFPYSSYKKYVENKTIILKPYHQNSLLYVKHIASRRTQNLKNEASSEIQCYWFFPAQHGHKQCIHSLTTKDVQRLTRRIENGWLNDSVVNFGLKYIYASWPSHLKEKVLVLDSYLYQKLSKILLKKQTPNLSEFEEIIKQTKNFVNIFKKQYILMPVVKNLHWNLIVVKNHGNQSDCEIFVLESFNKGKECHKNLFRFVQRWLNCHAFEKWKNAKMFNTKNVRKKCVSVPRQPNLTDCGSFLLKNVEYFGKEEGLRLENGNKSNWYNVEQGKAFREILLDVIKGLCVEQNSYLHPERQIVD